MGRSHTGSGIGFGYLTSQLLIAMPHMEDQRFARAVVYMCAHTEDGAMGLVVNRLIDSITFPDLLGQLGIETAHVADGIQVHFGGPVESGRGFILHTADFIQDSTLVVDDRFALTATVDILKAVAEGHGPQESLFALGYAGWGAGQIEAEILANGWLQIPADEALVFGQAPDEKWESCMSKLGIDFNMLSGDAGHA